MYHFTKTNEDGTPYEGETFHVRCGTGENLEIVSKDYLSLLNQSKIHVDFMVGAEDLTIEGYTKNGQKVAIFENGSFAPVFQNLEILKD